MSLQGFIGITVFIGLAFLFSENRKAIDWKIVLWGLVMQFVIAGIILGNTMISLACLFIYIFAIVLYNINMIGFAQKSVLLQGVLSLGIIIGLSYIFSLFGQKALFVRNIAWNVFLIVGAIKVISSEKFNIPLPKRWANYAGIIVCTTIFGSLWGSGTTGADLFKEVGDSVIDLLDYAKAGGSFVFGGLYTGTAGWIFAIDITVSIIFFTALISIIDSLGLLNQIISSIARFINWNMLSMGIKPLSGAETLVSIPLGGNNLLFVKSYLDKLTNSEITVMLSGVMATISASLFAAFISVGISPTHLLRVKFSEIDS
ncbi:MAG: Na+ dependent nucleoside transporter N-terminal domain-containing protein [Brevinema sp.]